MTSTIGLFEGDLLDFFLILGGKTTTNTLVSFFWSSDCHQNGIGIDLPISRGKNNKEHVVFSSHLKNISEIGSFPQVRVKIKHIFQTCWNHHLVMFLVSTTNTLGIQSYSQIMIGMFNHLSIVFRFHYHSQEVIGSLGIDTSWLTKITSWDQMDQNEKESVQKSTFPTLIFIAGCLGGNRAIQKMRTELLWINSERYLVDVGWHLGNLIICFLRWETEFLCKKWNLLQETNSGPLSSGCNNWLVVFFGREWSFEGSHAVMTYSHIYNQFNTSDVILLQNSHLDKLIHNQLWIHECGAQKVSASNSTNNIPLSVASPLACATSKYSLPHFLQVAPARYFPFRFVDQFSALTVGKAWWLARQHWYA